MIINKKTQEFFLLSKKNSCKIFCKSENSSNKENDFIEIEYSCFYKSFSIPVYKESKIESIEDARKKYKNS